MLSERVSDDVSRRETFVSTRDLIAGTFEANELAQRKKNWAGLRGMGVNGS